MLFKALHQAEGLQEAIKPGEAKLTSCYNLLVNLAGWEPKHNLSTMVYVTIIPCIKLQELTTLQHIQCFQRFENTSGKLLPLSLHI